MEWSVVSKGAATGLSLGFIATVILKMIKVISFFTR
jgi:hypothetical protein